MAIAFCEEAEAMAGMEKARAALEAAALLIGAELEEHANAAEAR